MSVYLSSTFHASTSFSGLSFKYFSGITYANEGGGSLAFVACRFRREHWSSPGSRWKSSEFSFSLGLAALHCMLPCMLVLTPVQIRQGVKHAGLL